MTLRVSTGLRDFLLDGGSLKDALQGGQLLIYSGAQPASADSAPTGTLLATITDSSAAHADEVQASATITLTGGAAGSIDNVLVNSVDILAGVVPFNTSLSQTAADLAAALNKSISNPLYKASASGAVVTLKAKRGMGALPNGWTITVSETTLTSTVTAFSGGVNSANGLKFGVSAAGVLSKDANQTWSGVAVASGTAGWFRYVGAVTDSGLNDGSESQIRIDGAVATSGAQINMTSTTITAGATQTISGFDCMLPTS